MLDASQAQKLHRYYRLDVQPDLFGAWCFIREWGRIGRSEGAEGFSPNSVALSAMSRFATFSG